MVGKRVNIILRIIVILGLLAFLYGALWLYFNNLKDGCSLPDDRVGWGTFGDYLSGVFAMFNLGVVVFLTVYVADLDKKRSERELELQKKVKKQELIYQKKLLLAQFRISNCTKLNKALIVFLYPQTAGKII
ncbi:MAG: hypothetical protein IPN08_18015 [Bacteroidales bacterium]|nr:hypothetical protein [Bacteroidales bacterium]